MKQEYEYEVWQGHSLQAGGITSTPESTIEEADHYAMMYGQDGPVKVRFFLKQEVTRAELKARQAACGHDHWSIGGVGPDALSDAQCDRIISCLDEYARGKSSYEYGLPMFHDDAMPAMREIVRAAASG